MRKFVTILKPSITLLKYSSLSLDPQNIWLIDILKMYDKLSYTDIIGIPNLTSAQQSFLLNNLNVEADRISAEWNAVSDVPIPNTNNEQCELCGNKHCNSFYLIKNKHTGKELKVGSSCIKKYEKISKTFGTEGLDKVLRLNYLVKAKYTRENLIIENVGTKEDTFIKWLNKKFDFILDIDTYEKRNKLIQDFTLDYNNYIDKGIQNNPNLFDYLNSIKNDIEILDTNIITRQNSCDIHNLDCPFYIKSWVSENNKHNSIIARIMQNNGKVNTDTIKHIYCDRYINEFIPHFNNKLSNHNALIKEVKDNTLLLTIKNFKYDFVIHSKNFMDNFGELIVYKTMPINFNKFSELLSIDYNNENTTDKLINDFNKIMHFTKYEIRSSETKYGITNYYIYDKYTKQYASKLPSPPKILLNKCIKYIISENKKEAVSGISDILNKISEWEDFSIIKKYT